jgi:tetratricopeptide (TPR) repeat protein
MIALLRPTQERVFPIISANIYELSSKKSGLVADQKAARNILQLANESLSPWQNLTGLGLDSKGQLGHLLLQHKLALEAELSSKWQRADFFWNQVQIELKTLLEKAEFWEDISRFIANIPDVQIMNKPAEIRQRLLHELFSDTHCAFYNGLIRNVQKAAWNERAFVHINYIQKLLELSVVSGEEVKNLLGEAWQTRINAYKEAKKWRQAISYCQERLKWLPYNSDFQAELVEVHYLENLAKCSEAQTSSQHSQNAKTLQRGIQKLEKYLKQYPYNLIIFQLLGNSYYLRAVSLQHNSRLSESLLSIQKAIAYNPLGAKAYKKRSELMERMTQLQERANQLLVNIRHNGTQLNHQELKLQAEAKKGFGRMNIYIDSDEAKAMANGFKVAEAVYLWHRIGLLEPHNAWVESAIGVMGTPDGKTKPSHTNNSIKIALLLKDTVSYILQHPPKSASEVIIAWQREVETKPVLAELDNARICIYLEHSLFEKGDRVLVTPPTGHSEPPQLLRPISTQLKMSTEPFIPWMLSSQDKRIKIQAIAATVLAITTGCIVMRERAIVAKRENAYQTILAAKQVGNDEAVLKASKEFFNNTSVLKNDERISQILEIYEESLVRWFPQQPEGIKPENNEYLELYKQLQK